MQLPPLVPGWPIIGNSIELGADPIQFWVDPSRKYDNIRHADLVALFIFNFWNATGLLPMTEAALASLGS